MKIGVVIPTRNEEGNVERIYERLTEIFRKELPQFDYEILYIDNKSTDRTRGILEELCKRDKRVKCIFNVHDFEYFHSVYHGMTQSDGDATFLINCDMQEPPEMLVDFVREWQAGTTVVLGIKEKSNDPLWIQCFRKIYYWTVACLAESKQIAHCNGFGLYDRSYIQILRDLDDRDPYPKNLVVEYASSIKTLPYHQERRKSGRGTTNFFRLYDFAMTGITSTSKIVLRMCTFIGMIISLIAIGIGISAVVSKLMHWDNFQFGIAGIAAGVFFLGGIELFFLGILGEYILSISKRVTHRPVVVEERRLNFECTNTQKKGDQEEGNTLS